MTAIAAPDLLEERRTYALMLRLLAISCFSVMNVLIKLSSARGVPIAEMVFWRQSLSLPIILLLLWRGPGLGSVRTQRFAGHVGRSALGFVCMVMAFESIILLPLAEATTLGYVAPLFTIILSILFFGEKVGPRRGLATLVGFVGVLIVAQPAGQHLSPLGMAAALGAALLVGFISFKLRELGRTEPTIRIVFWFGALSTILMLPMLPFVIQPHDALTWLLLLGIGTLGGLAQLGMTASLRHAPVSAVVGMDYVSLLWAVLFGWMIWGQLPSTTTWIGAAIIIASCLYIVWREHRLELQKISGGELQH